MKFIFGALLLITIVFTGILTRVIHSENSITHSLVRPAIIFFSLLSICVLVIYFVQGIAYPDDNSQEFVIKTGIAANASILFILIISKWWKTNRILTAYFAIGLTGFLLFFFFPGMAQYKLML